MGKIKKGVLFLFLSLLILLTSCSITPALNISENKGNFLKSKSETITSTYKINYSGDFFINLNFGLKEGKVDWKITNPKGDIVFQGYVSNENGKTYRELTYPSNFSRRLNYKLEVKPSLDSKDDIVNITDFNYLPLDSKRALGIYIFSLEPTNAEGNYTVMWSNGITKR